MTVKKGFWANLFRSSKSDGCCNMEIFEGESCAEVKNEAKVLTCACEGGDCSTFEITDNESAISEISSITGAISIKVLGTGCTSCHTLLEHTKTAVKNLGISITVEYITDMEKIMEYGIMSVPALVINEKVVSMGKALKPVDIEKLLKKLGF